MTPARIAFVLGGAAASSIVVTLLVTLATDVRFWPPGDNRLKAGLHWGLVAVFDVALLAVAVLEWNTWVLPRPSSLLVGVPLSAVGVGVFGYSVRVMNQVETTGQTVEELYTDGPYARSRNPQYVGMLIGLVGFGLLANAALVVPLLVVHGCWLVLLPFAEEPWLREAFGDEFERYCEAVPRFVGMRTFEMRE